MLSSLELRLVTNGFDRSPAYWLRSIDRPERIGPEKLSLYLLLGETFDLPLLKFNQLISAAKRAKLNVN